MEITITKKAWAKMGGGEVLEPFGISSWNFSHYEERSLDLVKIRTPKRIKALLELLQKAGPLAAEAFKDTSAWNDAVQGKYQASRDLVKFTANLTEFLRSVPGHRVYRRDAQRAGAVQAFYVDEVEYNKATQYNAPYCEMTLLHLELSDVKATDVKWSATDCNGKTPVMALADKGYLSETKELRAGYELTLKRYLETYSKVGTQFLATGTATDNLDGNPTGDDRDSAYLWRRTKSLTLDRNGAPSRVVIDVRQETSESEKEKVRQPSAFWDVEKEKKKGRSNYDDDDDGDESTDEARPEGDALAFVDTVANPIPVWAIVPVFDFHLHLRLRVHINQLTEYQYDATMNDKLVLPENTRTVVSMLLEHRGGFKDIVGGKGNGAIVLCVGPPGVGKTLTAEVYAETAKMPLYSVQCSQLGLTPDALETELLKVFMRAQRWNAILMLDEADVYVAERGLSIEQNAIVGVFLRVLEYYQGVLFLTSNRADSIDDAVASRCLARLTYELPTLMDQARIWKVLSTAMGVKLSDKFIAEVVKEVGEGFVGGDRSVRCGILSGRDVRNLLQLALLFASSTGKPITVDTFKFAKQFQPTLGK